MYKLQVSMSKEINKLHALHREISNRNPCLPPFREINFESWLTRRESCCIFSTHLAEHHVLAVQEVGWHRAEEELTAVGVTPWCMATEI